MSKPELNLEQFTQFPIAWIRFMRYCKELDHGELEKVRIADGIPQMAEKVIEKKRFT